MYRQTMAVDAARKSTAEAMPPGNTAQKERLELAGRLSEDDEGGCWNDWEICCECGDNDKQHWQVHETPLVQCSKCHKWEHYECVAWQDEDNELDHVCRRCEPIIEVTSTLVVCPAAIAAQWVSEVAKHTAGGSMNVLRYDGASKRGGVSRARLATYDLVVTTYDALRQDIHKLQPPKRSGRKFARGSYDTGGFNPYIEPDYEDEEYASTSSVKRKKRKRKEPVAPSRTQIISPLTTVCWRRVCLDEAQQVESTATAAAKMALELEARYRWCVTGTPLQSGMDDIYGLFLFLGRPLKAHQHRTRTFPSLLFILC